ncbi:M20/M25/M40 family metallo-hydrolase [Roseovarius sp. M141]|uniref:M20/M25/M40 family metallo-hydrolase n=1 Tax=Roseovarius sp. M141 TaxID=2583806 RepID=UPI0020CCBCF2|nr:M20/M25/M40 family metallo-hydrolase [Roseovarius sp. M141]MCQ0090696.1 M28 family peptidase [Roseovarius sp. M141]
MAEVERELISALVSIGLQVSKCPYSLSNVAGNKDLGTHEEGDWSDTVYEELNGQNIVALKPGAGSDVIVLGAHFDTTRDSPGADDNTSSLVALLEVARLLAPLELDATLLFVAFDMEEIGYHGSRVFVRDQLPEPPKAAIVFESVGYTSTEPGSQKTPPGFRLLYPRQARKLKQCEYRGNWSAIVHRRNSRRLARRIADELDGVSCENSTILMSDPGDLPLVGDLIRKVAPFVRNFGRSDHIAFWEQNIPAIMITDTANFRNPHYHQPSDLPDTLDYGHLRQVIAATAIAIEALAIGGS